jgi:carbamoyl-phosphate synthase large subunit
MSTKQISVFVPSGAGAPGFGGIFHCLKQDAAVVVHAGDQNANSYGFGLADFSVQVPPSNHDSFIPFVKDYCKKHGIQIILPITTRELEPLSKNRPLFQEIGTQVLVSNLEGLRIANHKYWVLEHAHKLGIPVPQFKQVTNFEQLKAYCEFRFSEGLAHQCFKPVLGNGARGFGVVSRDINSDFLSQKSSWMPLTIEEWGRRMGEIDFNVPFLVSDYLEGSEYSVDVLVSNYNIEYCIPRRRDKMIGGISVAGMIENNAELIKLTNELVLSLDLNGPIGVQWKYDLEGIPRLLEINPRLQGTTSACLLAGVNIPLEAIKCTAFNDYKSKVDVAWQTPFTRYWMDINPIN